MRYSAIKVMGTFFRHIYRSEDKGEPPIYSHGDVGYIFFSLYIQMQGKRRKSLGRQTPLEEQISSEKVKNACKGRGLIAVMLRFQNDSCKFLYG